MSVRFSNVRMILIFVQLLNAGPQLLLILQTSTKTAAQMTLADQSLALDRLKVLESSSIPENYALEKNNIGFTYDDSYDDNGDISKQKNPSTGGTQTNSAHLLAKRPWGKNNMDVWGKRNSYDDAGRSFDSEEKQATGGAQPNSVHLLAKRPWGKNNMDVWGKRNSPSLDKMYSNDDLLQETIKKQLDRKRNYPEGSQKRKWGINSMDVWGKKRSNEGSYEGKEEEYDTDRTVSKRRWGKTSMDVWGKRTRDIVSDKPKPVPKWGVNTMDVWGRKRSGEVSNEGEGYDDDEADLSSNTKRRWGKTSMDVWGKRTRDIFPDRAKHAPKWGRNSMNVWG